MRSTIAIAALLAHGAAHAASSLPDSASVDAAVRAFMTREGIPAAHVTILRGNEVILRRGYGIAGAGDPAPDANSIFPLGSISKQFTAAVILALADQGKVQLDAPVGRYLPEWFADEPDLRVTHLLTQTSGLADFLWLEGYRTLADEATTPIASYVALAAAAPRRYAPGTRWSYSNTNYKALALIAERVDGPAVRQPAPRTRAAPGGYRGNPALSRPAPRSVRARRLQRRQAGSARREPRRVRRRRRLVRQRRRPREVDQARLLRAAKARRRASRARRNRPAWPMA